MAIKTHKLEGARGNGISLFKVPVLSGKCTNSY